MGGILRDTYNPLSECEGSVSNLKYVSVPPASTRRLSRAKDRIARDGMIAVVSRYAVWGKYGQECF